MTKTTQKPADQKSEFLMELAERFNYWTAQKNTEYAKAYERLLYAFTMPEQEKKP